MTSKDVLDRLTELVRAASYVNQRLASSRQRPHHQPTRPPMANRSLANRLWYLGLKVLAVLSGMLCFRLRCYGRQNVPRDGGVLVLSNHQSNLDPVLVGIAVPRRLNYLARETLFGFAPFRWLIRSLDAIPIDREGLGLSGLKECLRRLKRGEMVLLFPEGTRTSDGEVGALKAGFCAWPSGAESGCCRSASTGRIPPGRGLLGSLGPRGSRCTLARRSTPAKSLRCRMTNWSRLFTGGSSPATPPREQR